MGRTKNSGLSVGTRGNPQIQLDNYDLQNKLITQAGGGIVSGINSLGMEEDLEDTTIVIGGKISFIINVYPENEINDSVILEICKEFQKNRNEVEKILTLGGILYKGDYTETIKKAEVLNFHHIRYKIEMVAS